MALKQMEPTEVQIGENKFYIRPFAAFKAANITGELASVLTPLFGAFAPLLKDRKEDEEKDLMDIDAGDAAEAIANCSGISGDKLEKLMRKLLTSGNIAVAFTDENGEAKGEKLTPELADEIFCGDVQDMFILCFHVIRLNYNGFFGQLSALSGKAGRTGRKIARKIL